MQATASYSASKKQLGLTSIGSIQRAEPLNRTTVDSHCERDTFLLLLCRLTRLNRQLKIRAMVCRIHMHALRIQKKRSSGEASRNITS
jgi:hypothetical protein